MASILLLQHQRPDGEVDSYHLKSGRRYHVGRGSQCQVRILDLKLSRQHCAFEHADAGWQLVDLASTNGCTLDGERVTGSRAVRAGSVVAAGQTSLTVLRILDEREDLPEEDLPPAPTPDEAPRPSERLAAMAARSDDAPDELEPASLRSGGSEPLMRGPAAAAPLAQPNTRADQVRTPLPDSLPNASTEQDGLATLAPPAAREPAKAEENTTGEPGSRSYFINVLGKRVGPLTRIQARELKAKELKGDLTPSDLAKIEANVVEAKAADTKAAPPAPTAGSPEDRTYYVTLLGKRVGPLSRTQARELKAKELKGTLSAEEVERLGETR